MVKKYLDSGLTLENIEKHIIETVERKTVINDIKCNHYDEFIWVERVAKSIGNVPTEAVEDVLIRNIKKLGNISKEQLVELAVAEFKQYRILEKRRDSSVPKLIEAMLHSEKTTQLLTSILSNESTLYAHSEFSTDGTFLTHNITVNNAVIGFLTNYLIIHQEEYEMDKLYEILQESNINSMNSRELNDFFNRIIVLSVQKKLGLEEIDSLEAKEKIANFVYTNYVENGYCFQGLNGNYRDSVMINGLTSKFSRLEDSRLIIVDDIFKKHGLDKIFYSKLDETTITPYYYTTDQMSTAYHYSYHNPEWFSYFCASGNNMPDNEYDRSAYYMRDKESCRKNLEKLCANYHLSPQEQRYVLDFFSDSWENLIGNCQENAMVLIERQILNRNKIPFEQSTLEHKTPLEIVNEILTSNYDIDIQFLDIPREYIDVIDVPMLSNFYDRTKIDTASVSRTIKLASGEDFSYDILIHADNVDIDCVSIVDGIEPTLISKTTKEGKSIDVIQCSSNINENSVLSNGAPSFQTLEMLIAVNGVANSEKGKQLLAKARESYSPAYMSDYYYHLSNFMCDLALNPHVPDEIKTNLLIRVAKDIYPKAELMKSTDNYPQYVDEDKKLFSYLEYHELLLVKKVESMRGNVEPMDSASIVQLATLFREKINGKVNEHFTNEFNAKIGDFRTAISTFITLSSNGDKTIPNSNEIGNNAVASPKK
jgi:hypothetical protein